MGVETGGCPHTAIREDASMNMAAVADLIHRFPKLDYIFVKSGDKIPRKAKPFILTNMKTGHGIDDIVAFYQNGRHAGGGLHVVMFFPAMKKGVANVPSTL